jgi:hypothetical protein
MARNLLKWAFIVLTVFVSFVGMGDSIVLACGGGASQFIETLLEETEVVVKARPVAMDALHQNGVLQVETYLVGGAGPEFLLFVQSEPVNIARIFEGGPYGFCDTLGTELQAGETGYYFLKRRPDGAYVSTTLWHEPDYYTFPDTNSTIRMYSNPGENSVRHELTEADIAPFIAEFSVEVAVTPDRTLPYPRLAPLKVSTAYERNYVLPVDRETLIPADEEFLKLMMLYTLGYDSPGWNEGYFLSPICPSENCVQITPDGLNRAWQDRNQVRWFGGQAEGAAFLFSSTSDAIAVWNGSELVVYTLGYERPEQSISEVTKINAVTLAGVPPAAYPEAAWTPDGRGLAYSDSDGLWLMDVYRPASSPRLLLPADNGVVPVAKHFSPIGRYLSFRRGAAGGNLDVMTDEILPDGIFSPNERMLLAHNIQADVFGLQFCELLPSLKCEEVRGTLVELSTGDKIYAQRFTQVEWLDNYNYLVVACASDDLSNCFVDRRYSEKGMIWRDSVHYTSGYGFAYEPHHDYLAVIQDGNILLLNGVTHDLSSFVEEKITAVEWLPSLFYRRL